MRMKELSERTGLPRTTIHHYLREHLLPPPTKRAANTSEYTENHLHRLQLIQRLRAEAGGALPLAQIRRVLEQVDSGVDPCLAIALQRAVLGDATAPGPERRLTLAEVAEQNGVTPAAIQELVEAGLVLPADDDPATGFDAADCEIASRLVELRRDLGCRLDELRPIAIQIREISQCEMDLRNRLVAGLDAQQAASRSLTLQQTGNLLHTYLFARSRQRNIAGLRERENQHASSNPTL